MSGLLYLGAELFDYLGTGLHEHKDKNMGKVRADHECSLYYLSAVWLRFCF
jgi:hypothetical protein